MHELGMSAARTGRRHLLGEFVAAFLESLVRRFGKVAIVRLERFAPSGRVGDMAHVPRHCDEKNRTDEMEPP